MINPLNKIYVIYSQSQGAVKIGFTRGDASLRLSQLQCGNPERLFLIHTEPGGVARERILHRRFEKYRIRKDGEWFKLKGEVFEWLSERKPETLLAIQRESEES